MSSLRSGALTISVDPEFAEEVRSGLTDPVQKTLPTRFLYDEVGSALFEAITALEEYGLTRADVRVLRGNAPAIADHAAGCEAIVELGSGNGTKTRALLDAFPAPGPAYRPVDLSRTALDACVRSLPEYDVEPIHAEFLPGIRTASRQRGAGSLLAAFLGSNLGNFSRSAIPGFLRSLRECLLPGDHLLIGADITQDPARLIPAYDDPAGVTAAFNRNLLARVNRQLAADFQLSCYAHEARWNVADRRVEMHLRALSPQVVHLGALDLTVRLRAGETIWTESSHKFDVGELKHLAQLGGFTPVNCWTDREWPFVEMLCRA